ncbi:MAG: M23 family metallopeptidase [Candidatus Paceibacterota bacterium]
MIKKKHARLSTAVFSLCSIVIALLFISPTPTHAGIVSFISSFLSDTARVVDSEYNSQNALVLKAARNVDPNPAKGGGDITVVDGSALLSETGPTGTLADVEVRPQHGGRISIYVVREGDSLSQIAKMFNVTTGTIIWANDIKKGSLIKEGQTLVILPVSGVQHIVEKGDTLQSIAKKYKGDFNEVLQYNDITENVILAVGDVITVPGGEVEAPVYKATTQVVTGSNSSSYSGYYMRPIVGGRKSQGIHGYNGVDLAAPSGTPILASATGDVIVVRNGGWNGGYGTYAVIRHGNGTQTLYSHMSTVIVYSGQRVVQGQVIGYVGSTGRSTGSHLHFEVRGAKNPF